MIYDAAGSWVAYHRGLPMVGEAEKYRAYARECARQAAAAENEERRRKLTELAQIWREAALTEEAAARGWVAVAGAA